MTKSYNLHANGIRQHIINTPGDGPEMLVVPGITSPAITWGFVAEALSKHFNVQVLDVRGRGLSETGDLDYSLDAMAEDVIAVAAQMATQTSNPIILGHSMGARIAIRASVKNADNFSGLILVDPPVSGPNRRPYPSPWPWYQDSILMARKGCSAEDMKQFCPTWTEEQCALRAEWLHTCNLGAIRIAYDGFHTDDIHADLPNIDLPMQLVKAGSAEVILPEDIEEIKTLVPSIQTYIVENAGHMIPWDNLEGFIDAVLDFKR